MKDQNGSSIEMLLKLLFPQSSVSLLSFSSAAHLMILISQKFIAHLSIVEVFVDSQSVLRELCFKLKLRQTQRKKDHEVTGSLDRRRLFIQENKF
jgi:hypothetical protein